MRANVSLACGGHGADVFISCLLYPLCFRLYTWKSILEGSGDAAREARLWLYLCLQSFSAFQAALLLLSRGAVGTECFGQGAKAAAQTPCHAAGTAPSKSSSLLLQAHRCYREKHHLQWNQWQTGRQPASITPTITGTEGLGGMQPLIPCSTPTPQPPSAPTAPSRRTEPTSAPRSALPTYFPARAVGNDQKHEG